MVSQQPPGNVTPVDLSPGCNDAPAVTEPADTSGTMFAELVNALLPNESGAPVHHMVKLVQ